MNNIRFLLISCWALIHTLCLSESLWAQGTQTQARIWADRVIEILPSDPALNVISDPSLESLKDADLITLRHAVQDVASDRLKLPRSALISLYNDAAISQNSAMDNELARLFETSGQPGRLADFKVLDPFLASSDWFVITSAYLEQTRHYLYQDPSKAQRSLRQAILQVPSHLDDPLVEEAKYNIAVLAQALTNELGDLDAAYETSQTLIALSVSQDRIVDRFLIVFNLTNIHASTFAYEDTSRITKALIDNSKRQSVDRQLIALGSHGYYTGKVGAAAKALPLLEVGIELVGRGSNYDLYFLDGLANAYIDDGQIEKASKTFAQIKDIRRKVGYPDGNDLTLNILEAKIARANGDFEAADGFETQISSELFRQVARQNRRVQSSFDYDFLGADSRSDVSTEKPSIYAFELPVGSLLNTTNTPGGVPENIVRKISDFQVELDLFQVEPQQVSPRRNVIDAFYGRGAIDLSKALSDYRNDKNSRTEHDIEFVNLFDAVLQSAPQIHEDDYSLPLTKVYAHIFSSKMAFEAGEFQTSYAQYFKAGILAKTLSPMPESVAFDMSELEMAMAMNNGNSTAVLEAGKQYLIAGRTLGQSANIIDVAGGYVLTTLGNAHYAKEVLSLSERFLLAAQRNQAPTYSALLAKGKALNSLERYEEAAMFLTSVLEQSGSESSEPHVLRELFIANAGAGNIDLAKSIRKNVLTALNKLNKIELTNLSSVDLAYGDYLLAVAGGESNQDDLYRNWKDKSNQYHNALTRHQSNLQNMQISANFAALEALSAGQAMAQADLSRQVSRSKALTGGLGIIALASLIALGYGYTRLKRAKAEQNEALHAAKVKGQFLNLIGHESRVSLQGIESFVESLKSSSVSMEHLPTVQIIGSQAEGLSQSISDYIFSARVISGDRPKAPKVFTAPEYRSRMLPVWQDMIGGRDVVISMNISSNLPSVYVDGFFLETAIGQIVKIALQKTRIGTIEIELSEERSLRGMRLNVSIEDTGSGISDEDQNNLFDFFEVDENGVSKIMHSQPLGFAIAKNAIDTLNGAMTVFSRLGRGTRVNFSVPVSRAAANDVQDA